MREDLIPTTYDGTLIRIIQEASEVIFHVTKIQQYGETATDSKTKIFYNNVEALLSEITDLKHAIATIEAYYEDRGFTLFRTDIPIPKLRD